jgi:hypothetical protein
MSNHGENAGCSHDNPLVIDPLGIQIIAITDANKVCTTHFRISPFQLLRSADEPWISYANGHAAVKKKLRADLCIRPDYLADVATVALRILHGLKPNIPPRLRQLDGLSQLVEFCYGTNVLDKIGAEIDFLVLHLMPELLSSNLLKSLSLAFCMEMPYLCVGMIERIGLTMTFDNANKVVSQRGERLEDVGLEEVLLDDQVNQGPFGVSGELCAESPSDSFDANLNQDILVEFRRHALSQLFQQLKEIIEAGPGHPLMQCRKEYFLDWSPNSSVSSYSVNSYSSGTMVMDGVDDDGAEKQRFANFMRSVRIVGLDRIKDEFESCADKNLALPGTTVADIAGRFQMVNLASDGCKCDHNHGSKNCNDRITLEWLLLIAVAQKLPTAIEKKAYLFAKGTHDQGFHHRSLFAALAGSRLQSWSWQRRDFYDDSNDGEWHSEDGDDMSDGSSEAWEDEI